MLDKQLSEPQRLRYVIWLLFVVSFSSLGLALLSPAATHATSHQFSQLHWSDEFNGSSVDSARWKIYHSNYGEGPGCNTPRNVAVDGGSLKITVRKETMICPGGKTTTYSGGFLGSREVDRYYPLYGKYEMRARLPHGQGLWPSFWLRRIGGASHAEVDIFELFHSSGPGRVTQSLHFPKSIGKGAMKSSTFIEEVNRAGIGGWHTYAVTISPVKPGDNSKVRFQFFVDGRMTKEYVNDRASAWTDVDHQRGWDIAISMNGGGDWVGLPDKHLGYLTARGGLCAKNFQRPPGGNPDACPTTDIARPGDRIFLANFAESSYIVDWVRVFKYTPNAPSATVVPAPDSAATADSLQSSVSPTTATARSDADSSIESVPQDPLTEVSQNPENAVAGAMDDDERPNVADAEAAPAVREIASTGLGSLMAAIVAFGALAWAVSAYVVSSRKMAMRGRQ